MVLTYLADYDNLASLQKGEEIEWVHQRIKRIFLNPIKKSIQKNNIDLPLGIMTLICCAIEALGHFRKGTASNSYSERDFKFFIKEYMPEASRIRGLLYNYFRCGLAHAFVIEQGSIEGEITNLYEKERRKKIFYKVNPWKLFELLEKGIDNYFKDLNQISHRKLRKNFRVRFEYSYRFWIENPPN